MLAVILKVKQKVKLWFYSCMSSECAESNWRSVLLSRVGRSDCNTSCTLYICLSLPVLGMHRGVWFSGHASLRGCGQSTQGCKYSLLTLLSHFLAMRQTQVTSCWYQGDTNTGHWCYQQCLLHLGLFHKACGSDAYHFKADIFSMNCKLCFLHGCHGLGLKKEEVFNWWCEVLAYFVNWCML